MFDTKDKAFKVGMNGYLSKPFNLQTIKRIYGKAKHQFVTIFEFSEYTGLNVEEIRVFLN